MKSVTFMTLTALFLGLCLFGCELTETPEGRLGVKRQGLISPQSCATMLETSGVPTATFLSQQGSFTNVLELTARCRWRFELWQNSALRFDAEGDWASDSGTVKLYGEPIAGVFTFEFQDGQLTMTLVPEWYFPGFVWPRPWPTIAGTYLVEGVDP